jgi:hypothetical protein
MAADRAASQLAQDAPLGQAFAAHSGRCAPVKDESYVKAMAFDCVIRVAMETIHQCKPALRLGPAIAGLELRALETTDKARGGSDSYVFESLFGDLL